MSITTGPAELPLQPLTQNDSGEPIAALSRSYETVGSRVAAQTLLLDFEKARCDASKTAINQIMIINVFVGAIQAQVLATTSVTNSTKLHIVSNTFGFTGLILIFLTTCAGILVAILQGDMIAYIGKIQQHV
ncbi:hypothetical protein BV25DRAFT_1918307 [Artomyces pyxidatus]|uniref:Uncharacterized protein n=1 Tax=Artomyces pyxidatus TaxID=48021 RepID=A0ACB8SV45_9AGAM|nr:hypothetical protein BV25DRAFT_1918307 [Artomyces pyxidatus]